MPSLVGHTVVSFLAEQHQQSTLNELLRWRTLREPGKRAYTFLADGESQESHLTWGELYRQALSVASVLQDLKLGGQRALLLYPPGLEFITGFFGCVCAGVTAVPAYPPEPARGQRTAPRLSAIVADSGASVALTTASIITESKSLFDSAGHLRLNYIATDSLTDGLGDGWREPAVESRDIAFIQYTSGSTGVPRGVMLTHANLLHNAGMVFNAFAHTAEDSYVSWLPTFHDMGFMAGVLEPLYAGIPAVLMPPLLFLRRPLIWLHAISKYRATTSGGPNFAYDLCARRITEPDKTDLDLSSWTVAFNGAEPVRADTLDRFASAFEVCGFRREAFYPCYGLAEATLIVSGGSKKSSPQIMKIDTGANEQNRVADATIGSFARRLVSSGRPLDRQQLLVVNPESLNRCSSEEIGEIWVAGPSVAQGYWNRSHETAETFNALLPATGEGPFMRTGDLGFLRDGELYITGRLKDLIIIRGLNHYPQDIELTVERSHAALRPGCGAAFSIEVDGEERLVVIQEIDIRDQLDANSVFESMRIAVLREHELQVHAAALIKPGTIPKTSSGKIQRHACRRGFLQGTLEALAHWNEASSPRDDRLTAMQDPASDQIFEAWLASAIAAKLGLNSTIIDVSRPISDYGLDSLDAADLAAAIERRSGSRPSLTALLQNYSISRITSAALPQSLNKPITPAEPTAEEYPLSHGQRGLWFVHRLASEASINTIALAVRIRSTLDVRALRASFQLLTDRHPCLRTVINEVSGEPAQRVLPSSDVCFDEIDAEGWADAALNAQLIEGASRPFDLANGPLLRIKLFRLATHHVMLLCVHHIIVDFWSLSLMMRELSVLYRLESGNEQSRALEAKTSPSSGSLADIRISYADYVRWQRQLLAEDGDRLWAYWREQLKGDLPVLELPTDRKRPATQTYSGARKPFTVAAEATDGLKLIAKRAGTTLYTTLFAALYALLYRYTGDEDMVLGSPVSGRTRTEIESLIGYFANMVAIRARPSGSLLFSDLLGQVQQRVLEALDHQDFPFQLLVDRLSPVRDPSRSPLFQVVFSFQKARFLNNEGLSLFALGEAGARADLGGLELESIALDRPVAQFDLMLLIAESDSELKGSFEYNTGLFDAATVERLSEHYLALIKSVLGAPDKRLSQLQLLLPAELDLLVTKPGASRIEHPVRHTLHELFTRYAEQHPEAIALVFEGQRMSYGELNRRANQLANRLRRLGVGPEIRVGLCTERSFEMVVGILGVLKTGGAYVPMDPAYPDRRLALIIDDSAVQVLLTGQAITQRIENKDLRLISLDAEWPSIECESEAEIETAVDPDNAAYIIYTSGSTGRPKGAVLTHRNVVRLFESTRHLFGFSNSDVWSLFHSIAFDFSVWELWGALLHGGTVAIIPYWESRTPEELHSLIRRERVTVLSQTPSAFARFSNAGTTPDEREQSLRLMIFGGETLDVATLKAWIARHRDERPQLINMYGITETTVHVTYHRVKELETASVHGSIIGRGLEDLRVYVLDSGQEIAPIGIRGEIYISGDGLAREYLDRADLTAERFIPDPFTGKPGERMYGSGDLGRYLPTGELAHLGRKDHQVKIRGHRIEPGEIEAALQGHSLVSDCAVIPRVDRSGELRLVAYIVGNDQEPISQVQLRDYLKARLPEYMLPASIMILDQLPLTENGKLNRRLLPDLDETRPELTLEYEPPETPLEKTLAGIWSQVLGIERVGKHDNFFALGGDSILSMQVVSRARDLELNLTPRQLFQYQTIAELSAVVSETAHQALTESEKPPPVVESNQTQTDYPRGLWLRPYVEPRSEIEQALAVIWQEVFGLEQVGIDDDFFQLGGDSILSIQLITRARRAGLEITPKQIFRNPTIAELAAVAAPPAGSDLSLFLREAAESTMSAAARNSNSYSSTSVAQPLSINDSQCHTPPLLDGPQVEDSYPLTWTQQGMLFHSLFENGSGVYCTQVICELGGRLDADKLEAAWQAILNRHRALRTTFEWEHTEGPLQVVRRDVTVKLDRRDWRDVPRPDQKAWLDEYLGDDLTKGFDLRQAPLMRIALMRAADLEHWLVWSSHHLLMDGWSVAVVLKDLFAAYIAAPATGELDATMDRAEAVSFKEYVRWLRRQDAQEAESFWRETLRGFTTPTSISVDSTGDHSSPPEASYREESLRLNESTTAGLRTLARTRGLTLSTLFEGAWALLLSRYSGEDDIVFGVTLSGRPPALPEIESSVGLFINTLPLRVQSRPELPAIAWMKDIQDRLSDVRQYEYSSLSQVQGWSEAGGGTPLFESIFVFENYPVDRSLTDGEGPIDILDIRSIEQTNYPLTIAVTPGQDLTVSIGYDSGRFDGPAVERMLSHLQTILEAVIVEPHQPLFRISLLPRTEEQLLIFDWNQTGKGFAPDACLHDLFSSQARRTPDAASLRLGDLTLTYGQLDLQANQLANHLQSCGVRPGDCVGISLERDSNLIIAVLAVLKAGAVYLPLDPAFPTPRLTFMIEDATAKLVITEDKLLERFSGARLRQVAIGRDAEAIGLQSAAPPRKRVSPDCPAYVIYTSGSTGKPKGVMVRHRSAVNHMQWFAAEFPLSAADCVMMKYSIGFDASLVEMLYPLACGAAIAVAGSGSQHDTRFFIDLIDSNLVTSMDVVPAMLGMLLEDEKFSTLTSLRRVFCGGEVMSADLEQRLWKAFPQITFANVYGPTEATITATYCRRRPGERLPAPIGKPIANTQVYILDRLLNPVPIGVSGEICIGGAGVALGYINRPDLTAERFVPDSFTPEAGARLYRSGDLGRRRGNGDIMFGGRVDRQVKVHGVRIEPGEIAFRLRQHPVVRDAAVVLRKLASGRKGLVAYVTFKVGESLAPSLLRAHLREQLPDQMIPGAFVFLDKLPLLPGGKIDERSLPPPDATRPARQANGDEPKKQIERELKVLWQEVFGVENVGVEDNFFDLGGDSIVSIQLMARARQAGIDITPTQIFEHPTVAELASVAGNSTRLRPNHDRVEGNIPLTPIQRWFFEQELPEPHHYNQAVLITLSKPRDVRLIAEALNRLVAHHDALRLRFKPGLDGWRQSYASSEHHRVFQHVDISLLPPDRQSTAITTIADTLHSSLDLTDGPIIRSVFLALGSKQSDRMLVVIHHLAVDGVSWRILLEDLDRGYEQLAAGGDMVLPRKTLSYKRWSELLAEQARSEAVRREMTHWAGEAFRDAIGLPVDYTGADNVAASTASLWVSLDSENTRKLLHDLPAAQSTQINEVLLTALAQSLSEWTAMRRLLVDLEGHGREEIVDGIDVSRTVGWFTTIFPVFIELPESDDPTAALRSVKEQLRRIPNKGIGYGLLRYLSDEPSIAAELAALPPAGISFNYLGQIDRGAALSLSDESTGNPLSQLGKRSHLIEVDAWVRHARFEAEWSYSAQVHSQATIAKLAGAFIENLKVLIQSCLHAGPPQYSPLDFPLANVTALQLERLLSQNDRIEDLYPLSPMQQGMLFHSLYQPRSDVYCVQLVCDLEGALNQSAFREAWQAVVRRHGVLRTSFEWEGLDQPLQIVRSTTSFRIDVRDWRGLEDREQERNLEQYLADDRAKGFDLRRPHLMRLALIRVDEKKYRLVWTSHHLLLDGWSLPLILKDVFSLYEGYAGGHPPPISSDKPYSKYVAWLQKQDAAVAEQFWRDYLTGFRSPNRIGRSVPAFSSPDPVSYAKHEIRLSRKSTAGLQSFARNYRLTVSTILEGLWGVLVGVYSGSQDVVFGVVFSGRTAGVAGIEGMAGLFINTLPMRIKTGADSIVVDWFRRIQQQQVEMRQYEHVPLANVQAWSELPAGIPLFETLFIFENYPIDESVQERLKNHLEGIRVTNIRSEEMSNYPLTVWAAPEIELAVRIGYDVNRFDHHLVIRLAEDYQAMLELVGESSEQANLELSKLVQCCRTASATRTADQLLRRRRGRGIAMKESSELPETTDLEEQKRRLLEYLLEEEGIQYSGEPEIAPAREHGEYFPPSFAQQRLWFLDQLTPGAPTYNIPEAFRLYGKLDVSALRRSLDEVTRRHESLRTRFTAVEGQPMQVVIPPLTLGLPVTDLSQFGRDEQERQVSLLASEDAQTGFDLAEGPLFRAKLLRLTDDEHVLLLCIHHIVFDGWSMSILVRELTALYDAFCSGKSSPLRELPIQFKDFTCWQRQSLQGEALAKQLAYWKEQIGGELPMLALPIDHPRPAVRSSRGGCESLRLSKELSGRIKQIGRDEGTTLFMTLLAAFDVLLSRYSGQEDISVGTPIANRNRQETEELIGFFANTLVIRVDTSGDPTFLELLARVRELTLEAYAYQDLPFEKLVEELHPERDLSHTPLFQAMFALQNTPAPEISLSSLKLVPLTATTGTSKFDLLLSVEETGQELFAVIEYSTDLFEAETVDRMLAHYRNLLESVAVNPNERISRLRLLDETERTQMIRKSEGRRTLLRSGGTIHELLQKQVESRPDAVSVSFEGQQVSYRELNERADRVASRLRSAGVGPEVLVGICAERSVELVIGVLAILKAGGAYVPLDPSYPDERLSYLLQDSSVPVLLVQQQFRHRFTERVPALVCLDDPPEKEDRQMPASVVDSPADCPAYVVYTSGSTGKPKGVVVTHRNVVRLFEATRDLFRFSDSDVWVLFHSYAFDFSVWEIWGALLQGARLVVPPYWVTRTPDSFRELLASEAITVLSQTPSAFNQLDETERSGDGSSRDLAVRTVIFGGEALELSRLKGWIERHGDEQPELINMYGITETTVHVTNRRINKADVDAAPGSLIGAPLSDLSLHLLDPLQEPVPIGIAAEICVGGSGIARGYLNRPDYTAEKFIPGPFSDQAGERLYRSGDLGRYLANGDVEYVGRIDQQVKVRGFRIELGEIAATIETHPGVRQSVVIARKIENETRIVAYVVRHLESVTSIDELRDHLSARLPDYMMPAAIVSIESLPLTPHGKIDRRALPEPKWSRPDSERIFIPPRTSVEQALAEVWQEVLGVERVGIDDNYFALGGDSIRSIQLRAKALEKKIDLSLQGLFRHQTIRKLAAHLSESETIPPASDLRQPFGLISDADRSKLPAGVEDAYPLSQLQAGMVFHSEYSADYIAYLTSFQLKIPLDIEKLQAALDQMASRHEMLRTSFDFSSYTEPLQLVHRTVRLPLIVDDIRQLEAEDQQEFIESWLAGETRKRLDWGLAPLLRFHLHLLSDGSVQFTMTEPFLDGWSVASLLTELFERYLALRENRPISVEPALEAGYRDFVRLEREALCSDECRGYWSRALGDATASRLYRWPFERDKAPVRDVPRLEVRIPEEVSQELKRLARYAEVSLKSTLLAAHMKVISLLTGQHNVITGLLINGRPEKIDGERLLGAFLNTVPFRIDTSRGAWIDLVKRTFEAESDLFTFRRYPIQELQRLYDVENLFDTVFNYTHFHVLDRLRGISGLEVLDQDGTEQTYYSLTAQFNIDNASSAVRLELDYRAIDLGEQQVENIALYYSRVLNAMAADPLARHDAISFLSAGEERQLVLDLNDTESRFSYGRCAHHLFEEQVGRTPDATALVFEEHRLSYNELDRRANQVAGYLRTIGARPELMVGLCIERSCEIIIGVLGVLKSGASYLPLDPDYPPERLRFMLNDSHTRVVLTTSQFVERLSDLGAHPVCIDSPVISEQVYRNQPSGCIPENLAYVIYTSGSTGKPKGVLVEHRGLTNVIEYSIRRFELGSNSRILQCASLSFDASALEIFAALLSGGALHLVNRDLIGSGIDLGRTLTEQQITALAILPSLLDSIPQAELPDLETVIVGGEACGPETAERWSRGRRLINAYAPTEATIYATAAECPEGRRLAPPIGRPVANLRVYLLDSSLHPVPIGVPGELHIGGRGVARGYLDLPDLTAEKFVPDISSSEPGGRLYRTGDLARFRPDSNIEFLGRTDHQVKLRGFRIELGEIEAILGEHPCVHDSAVLLREDIPGDRRLVAYVVANDSNVASQKLCTPEACAPRGSFSGEPETLHAGSVRSQGEFLERAADLRAFLKQKLPDYMSPATFVFLESMPLTTTGKIERRMLPPPEVTRPELAENFAAPRSQIEELIGSTWAHLFRMNRVGVNDDFLELGGHSLLATQLVSRIRTEFKIEIPIRALFENPTVRGLARQVEAALQRAEESPPPITRASRPGSLPLSFAQQRLWFLDQFEPGSSLYNIAAAVAITGPLNLKFLEQSIAQIIRRHESLRTTFSPCADGSAAHVVQVIHPPGRWQLPVRDFGYFPEAERDREALRIAAEEARTPFNLEEGPLIRASLLRLSDTDHRIVLVMHHIVSDGWSMGIFVRELAELYQAYCEEDPSPLPELPIQYADFSVWQREWLRGEALERQVDYWRRELAGLPPLLDLPADHPRPAAQTFEGAAESFALTEEVSHSTRQLAQARGVTLYMLLLAAFDVLLHRYTGQDDIAVGTPIANRNRQEVEGLIGFFVNTLVMRATLSDDPAFTDLLGRVKETALGAYAHQDLPFEKLVEELNPIRNLSHTPVFQVMFDLQNASSSPIALKGLTLTPLPIENLTAKFDLTLTLAEAGGLSGSLEYNTDLFDQVTIERLVANLRTLLTGAIHRPDRRISSLSLFTESEAHQVLVAWNATEAGYSCDRPVHELFERQVERSPHGIAVVCGAEQLSYLELNARANRLASLLRKLGAGLETRVGLCAERSLELIAGLLGVMKAGAAYVPLVPNYPGERLDYILNDSRIGILITQKRLLERFSACEAELILLDDVWELTHHDESDAPGPAIDANHPAYVIYTSGSTGQPKGVVITHRAAVNSTLARHYSYADRVASFLLLSSFAFDSSVAGIYWTLTAGGTLVIPDESNYQDPVHLAELIASAQISHLLALPSFYQTLLEQQQFKQVRTLRNSIIAGEACSSDLVALHHSCLPGAFLYNEYGPTETAVWCSVYNCSSDQAAAPVPIGRAIANVQIYLLDRRLQPVPIGASGEIHVGGLSLARGYLAQPALTAERFIPHPFSTEPGARLYKTGDLARFRHDGNIEFLGRNDFQVKIRGFRVELGEIEVVLNQHPAVHQAVVVLNDDHRSLEKRLVAYLVNAPAASPGARELRDFLRLKLPDYMTPAVFVSIDSLPLTSSGKVDRLKLPAPDKRLTPDESYLHPETALEQVLVAIWEDLLEIEGIGVNHNFFEIGGHSLLATQVATRLRETLGVDLALRKFFEFPTVKALANAITADETVRDKAQKAAEIVLRLSDMSEEEVEERLEAVRWNSTGE